MRKNTTTKKHGKNTKRQGGWKNGKKCHVSSLQFKPRGYKVWPLSMRFPPLAFRTLSLTIRLHDFKWNKLRFISIMILWKKMFWDFSRFRAISLLVNRSTMLVEAVFKSSVVLWSETTAVLAFLNAGHTWPIAAKSACLLHVVNLVTLTVLIVKSIQVVTFANNVNRD